MAISISTKRLQIDRANSVVMVAVAVAAFLLVFTFFIDKALLSQRSYQSRVLKAKKKADQALTEDVKAAKGISSSYATFISLNPNMIGGASPVGPGPKDGNNAKIVLDALPSSYDFPALVTSIQQLLGSQSVAIHGITGTDDAIAQQASAQGTTDPVPIAIPFEVNVTGNPASIQNLFQAFQSSIRPFPIQSITMLADNTSNLTLDIKANTYYQPQKTLNITTETIK